jgi:hypothetical protein
MAGSWLRPALHPAQPYDDTVNPRSRAREDCGTKAYPVKKCAGLLWTYGV